MITNNPPPPFAEDPTVNPETARCQSCRQFNNCTNTIYNPNSICQKYKTTITYELNKTTNPPQIRFSCKNTNKTTPYSPYNHNMDPNLNLIYAKHVASELQCRHQDITIQWINAGAELLKQQSEPTPTLTAGLYHPQNNILFEQVNGRQYLTHTGQLCTQIQDTQDNQTLTYIPIPKEQITWKLCNPTPAKYEKTQLWEDIKQYLYDHIELPDPQQYDVITAWVLANWVPEKWNTVPYLFFFGPKGSGKSRALTVLQYLGYRANFSICCSTAALFRTIEKHNVTPFLDEAEVYNKDTAADIIACLNSGYKRETGIVQRYKGDASTGDVVNFRVFGFKALAGTRKLKDTVEDRSLIVRMARNTRDVNLFINERQAQHLRNQLLQWRFWALQNLPSPYDNPNTNNGTQNAEDTPRTSAPAVPKEFKDMHNSRVVELFLPLYAVAEGSARQAVVEYAQMVFDEQKDAETVSDEAEIVRAILDCRDLVDGGKLELRRVFEVVNESRVPAEQYKNVKHLGNIVDRLGLKKKLMPGTKRTGVVWNEVKIQALARRYLVFPSQTSQTSQSMVNPWANQNEASTTLSSQSSLSSQTLNEQQGVSQHLLQFQSIPAPAISALPAFEQTVACTTLPDMKGNMRKFNAVCPRCQKLSDLVYHLQFFDRSEADVCFACGSQTLEYLQKQEEQNHAY